MLRTTGPISVDFATKRYSTWTRHDWRQVGVLLAGIAALHLVAFGGLMFAVPATGHVAVGTSTFGVGLGITAYVFGVRHAFDVDHIAAIDNTTRKLRAEGRKPKSVGLWFALGHSTTVVILAGLVALGVHSLGTLVDDRSTVQNGLGLVSTLSSGGFLYLIGLLNLASLIAIWRTMRRMRAGDIDEAELDAHLVGRGLIARILRRTTAAIARPRQMFTVGLLFGLGFDTATEVALLVMAGTGVAAGVPWYVVILLPLLFAAGMTLFDSLDGILMGLAYDWAFLNPQRKVFYNLTVTGLSVAVALVIGSVQLAALLHDDLQWDIPIVDTLSNVPLGHVGFVVVGIFAVMWLLALAYWRLSDARRRQAGTEPASPK
ncbi:HoxN/HupN/NixA family nickel/cobalt transporter [Nocardia sp. BSTN01]|uniref:HoxN/HupN/NixA family nickel/cobalt transporter n=1 Tax=Nocardia sp. BSTN01 TaxID=2783665 RepID=UPI00188F83DA|nr:HoxN/HupN/NixA family nickel/cobalt transporter [Nocardia sp. BSTN01]